MLILFSVFVLSRTGLNEVIRNLPYILDDPGHGSLSFLQKTSVYFSSLWNATDLTPFLWMTYIFLFLFSLRFRKLEPFCFFAVCLLGVIFLLDLNFNFRLPWINIVMLPATLPGLFIAVHAKNDVIRKIVDFGIRKNAARIEAMKKVLGISLDEWTKRMNEYGKGPCYLNILISRESGDNLRWLALANGMSINATVMSLLREYRSITQKS